MLKMAASGSIPVNPKLLGEMTVSMLRGEEGFQRKEIEKLMEWLVTEPRFDVVNLPYSLLLGLAEPIKRVLKVPVCCTLQGDDLFLDMLGEPWRQQSMDLIRGAAVLVDAFMPVSQYYMEYMPGYLGIPASKMRLVPLGINLTGYSARAPKLAGPFTIGYLARIAPEKGLHVLCDAYRQLRTRPGVGPSRLIAAGYLPPEHQGYLDGITGRLREWGLESEFEYVGEVDRARKIEFLQGLDVLSVPTTYKEPKGIFLLEAMAAGVPVVQPRRGAFPEIVGATGGGLIVEPDSPDALADGLLALWRDPALAAALGAAGAVGVREHYGVERMAEAAEAVYRELAGALSAQR